MGYNSNYYFYVLIYFLVYCFLNFFLIKKVTIDIKDVSLIYFYYYLIYLYYSRLNIP